MQLPEKISEWPLEWKELFHERAGIMEFEGNLSQKNAESEAEKDLRKLAAKVNL